MDGPATYVEVRGSVNVVTNAALEETRRLKKATIHNNEEQREEPQLEGKLEYKRIRNLVNIKDNPVYSVALEEWNRQIEDERFKLVEEEKKKTDLTTQIYQIIAYFSVFQGVVLTAVSLLRPQSPSSPTVIVRVSRWASVPPSRTLNVTLTASPPDLNCNRGWLPFILSIVALGGACLALYIKFSAVVEVEQRLDEFRTKRDVFARRIIALLNAGEDDFRFHVHVVPNSQPNEGHNAWHYNIAVIVLLAVFSLIFGLTYFEIICNYFP